MCQSELTEFLAELTEFAAELSEFSLPKQYSRNSIPLPFPKISKRSQERAAEKPLKVPHTKSKASQKSNFGNFRGHFCRPEKTLLKAFYGGELGGPETTVNGPTDIRIGLGIRLPLTGVKIPKIGKRGSQSQKTPISHHPRKGRSESKKKSPFLYRALQGKWGFLTQSALFWGGGKWGFFDSETSFPDFGDFDPCKGQTNS